MSLSILESPRDNMLILGVNLQTRAGSPRGQSRHREKSLANLPSVNFHSLDPVKPSNTSHSTGIREGTSEHTLPPPWPHETLCGRWSVAVTTISWVCLPA